MGGLADGVEAELEAPVPAELPLFAMQGRIRGKLRVGNRGRGLRQWTGGDGWVAVRGGKRDIPQYQDLAIRNVPFSRPGMPRFLRPQ